MPRLMHMPLNAPFAMSHQAEEAILHALLIVIFYTGCYDASAKEGLKLDELLFIMHATLPNQRELKRLIAPLELQLCSVFPEIDKMMRLY